MTKQLDLFNFNILQTRKIINPRLGLPYKGAKRKIAHKLLQVMADYTPQANYEHNPYLEKKNFKMANRLDRLKELERLESLESLEQLERLESLERMKNVSMPCLNLSYEAVPIVSKPSETIIYLDPPYINTSDYKEQKGGWFNHKAFYQWCIDKAKEGYNVFISEYTMPEDRFRCIYSTEVLSTLCGANKASRRIEKLFIPIV